MAPVMGGEMPRNSLAERMALRGTWKSSTPMPIAQFGTPCRDSQERGIVKANTSRPSPAINLTPVTRANTPTVINITPAKTASASATLIAKQVLGNICAGAAAKIGNATIGRTVKAGDVDARPAGKADIVKPSQLIIPQASRAQTNTPEIPLKVPQPLRQAGSRKSMAQRMRLSVASHLRSVDYRPRRRKNGKQRPSIIQKPSRRKVGKQRPSYAPVTAAAFLRGGSKPITTEQPAAVQRMGLTAHAQAVIGHLTKTAQLEAATCRHAAVAQAQAATQALRASNNRGMKTQATNSNAQMGSSTSKLLQMQTSGAERRKDIMDANAPERRSAVPSLLKRVKLTTPKRVEDNYDVSDLEEDADGNRIEPDRSKKRQPSWSAALAEVMATVNKQSEINPDSIFGCQVPICDLDRIFPDRFYFGHKPVKRRRGSSCQWSVDRLTPSEVAAYSKKMGQKRSWPPKAVSSNRERA